VPASKYSIKCLFIAMLPIDVSTDGYAVSVGSSTAIFP